MLQREKKKNKNACAFPDFPNRICNNCDHWLIKFDVRKSPFNYYVEFFVLCNTHNPSHVISISHESREVAYINLMTRFWSLDENEIHFSPPFACFSIGKALSLLVSTIRFGGVEDHYWSVISDRISITCGMEKERKGKRISKEDNINIFDRLPSLFPFHGFGWFQNPRNEIRIQNLSAEQRDE